MGEYIPEEPDLSVIQPSFAPSDLFASESAPIQSTIKALGLVPHPEGGYFNQTDAAPTSIPSPYAGREVDEAAISTSLIRPDYDPASRRLSTTIFYFLTPQRPLGFFHRNRSRIIHTLHRGRGRYVLLHPDTGRLESFIVGQNVEKGEKLQWVVEGGVWKASFLLEEEPQEHGKHPAGRESPGLLISETVVPGFEFADHEFLSPQRLKVVAPESKAAGLEWLVREEIQAAGDTIAAT